MVEHRARIKDYESLDYDVGLSQVYNTELSSQTKWLYRKQVFIRWVITFCIGVTTGLVAVFIDYFVKLLSNAKYSVVESSIMNCSISGCLAVSLLILLLFNGGFVLISTLLTVFEPVAAGSGIPEIKCYLNGVKVPHVVRLRTLICKSVGVLFSVAGGLFVGKEGPMIHSGAVIGAGLPQFQSIALKWINLNIPFFRSDRDKRDFVSGGAAAGVAAAFGAPIGGVLFSLEEGSSFWNQELTWRTFFCSMSATFTLNLFISGIDFSSWGSFYQPGLINFGQFQCHSDRECHLWTVADLGIFMVMAAVGGCLGALFNSLNSTLTKYRLRHIYKRSAMVRIVEAVLVALATGSTAFVSAMFLGQCRSYTQSQITNDTSSPSLPVSASDTGVRTYFCPNGTYNDMATLFFNSQEVAIKQLFHQEGTFSLSSLGIFFMMFFLLACWTYGTAVPSGLFVPSLLCGAAYGRFVANILHMIGYTKIYSGSIALIGAAAFLGGVVRMTISLTVILIESTNQISYGLPIMVVLMISKWVGDLFNEGLYDIHIELKHVPLLAWFSPQGMNKLSVREVMSTEVRYVFPHTRVRSLLDLLLTTKHHAFPVCTSLVTSQGGHQPLDPLHPPDQHINSHNVRFRRMTVISRAEEERRRQCNVTQGREDQQAMPDEVHGLADDRCLMFHGLILRHDLVTLLNNNCMYSENSDSDDQPRITYAELTSSYPRYPDILDGDISHIDTSMIVDVTPYMNACPYTISPSANVTQAFSLFRTMGLRHLPVVSNKGEIVGIITRHNLTSEYLEEKLSQHESFAAQWTLEQCSAAE